MEPIIRLKKIISIAIFFLGATACLAQAMQQSDLRSVFGVEMESISAAGGLDLMQATNVAWARKNAVVWSDIESLEGIYNWSAMKKLEAELKNASSKGIQVILIVRSTPEWARKIPGTGPSCGPIAENKLPDFGKFMRALVARYSVAPYIVKYWELWNEPDIASSSYQSDNIFGCWGDPNDAFFGGGYYAEMLKVVYPQVKTSDPQAQVLIGGLLLDCDPRNGAGCELVKNDNLPPKFFEGILQNNGTPYFDGVSFHAYDYYGEKHGHDANSTWQSSWDGSGPVSISKAKFIRSLLNKYGSSNKFLINSETALLCDNCSDDLTFEYTKAYYLAQSYASAIALGLRANIWYSVYGWRGSGLLSPDHTSLPVYKAFEFGSRELGNATYVSDMTGYSVVRGYEFKRKDRCIWVIWSMDGSTHPIPLSSTPLAAWDAPGNSKTPAASMKVTINPLYLEWGL